MSPRRIIALDGPRQSGKTTAARLINNMLHEHGADVMLVNFADPVYYMATELTEMGLEDLQSGEWKADYHEKWGMTGRTMLNTLAEGLRTVNPRIWVDYLARSLDEYPNAHAIISDARTAHEEEFLRSVGAEIWHVHRQGHNYTGEPFDCGLTMQMHDQLLLNYGGTLRLKDNIRRLLFPDKPCTQELGAVSGVGPRTMPRSVYEAEGFEFPKPATFIDEVNPPMDTYSKFKVDDPNCPHQGGIELRELSKQEAMAVLNNHGYTFAEGGGHD